MAQDLGRKSLREALGREGQLRVYTLPLPGLLIGLEDLHLRGP